MNEAFCNLTDYAINWGDTIKKTVVVAPGLREVILFVMCFVVFGKEAACASRL